MQSKLVQPVAKDSGLFLFVLTNHDRDPRLASRLPTAKALLVTLRHAEVIALLGIPLSCISRLRGQNIFSHTPDKVSDDLLKAMVAFWEAHVDECLRRANPGAYDMPQPPTRVQ